MWTTIIKNNDNRTKSQCVRCIVYYRPPKDDIEKMTEFCDLLGKLIYDDKQMLILGDFNLPHVNWKSYSTPINNIVEELCLNIILELNLFQFFLQPTRGQNILDLILSNRSYAVENVNMNDLISDHCIVSADLVMPIMMTEKKEKTIRDFKNGDYDMFNKYLQNIDWYYLFDSYPDVQSRWNIFLSTINKGIELYVPLVTNKGRRHKHYYPAHIRRLLLKKNKKWKRFKSQQNLDVFEDYKRLRKDVKTELKKWRTVTEHKILHSGSKKTFWNYINNKMKNPRSPVIIKNKLSDTTMNDAEALNNYFTSVYVQDNGNLPNFEKRYYINEDVDNVNFSVVAIEKTLSEASDTHSSGPDGISAFLLKRLKSSVSLPLSFIYHFSYGSGTIPEAWKNAIVCPMYKGAGSRLFTENYRPISLTSVCCKIMESLLCKSILHHMTNNNFLTSAQHGFFCKSSTLTAQLSCYNMWFNAHDRGQWTDVISLDYSTAFDTVNHLKLLYKF